MKRSTTVAVAMVIGAGVGAAFGLSMGNLQVMVAAGISMGAVIGFIMAKLG